MNLVATWDIEIYIVENGREGIAVGSRKLWSFAVSRSLNPTLAYQVVGQAYYRYWVDYILVDSEGTSLLF